MLSGLTLLSCGFINVLMLCLKGRWCKGFNMEQIKCPECGENISKFALTCPNCGYPITETSFPTSENCIDSHKNENQYWSNGVSLTNENVRKIPTLNLIEAITLASRRLADTSGRSRRSEYWWWSLTLGIIGSGIAFIPYIGYTIYIIQYILMYSITFRRLHDVPAPEWIAPTYLYSYLATIFFTVLLLTLREIDSHYFFNTYEMESNGFLMIFYILYFIVIILTVVFAAIALYYLIQDSNPIADSKHGPSPKYFI